MPRLIPLPSVSCGRIAPLCGGSDSPTTSPAPRSISLPTTPIGSQERAWWWMEDSSQGRQAHYGVLDFLETAEFGSTEYFQFAHRAGAQASRTPSGAARQPDRLSVPRARAAGDPAGAV